MSDSQEARRAQLERGLGLGLAGIAALIGVTCASRGQLSSPVKSPRPDVAAISSSPASSPNIMAAPSPT
ncbi:MAG TPA: hypothetical protein VGL19_04150, partial [Polyangiaceae bacterium]